MTHRPLKLLSFLMMTTMLTGISVFPLRAQAAQPTAKPQKAAQKLPTVTVESTRGNSDGYQVNTPSLQKLTSPLRDTPKTITSIPRQLLDDQGATTMRDALRNVPGISLAAGEGGAQGDNLTIRGFTARSDFFQDGMRDFGSYNRDPFNTENIEVMKGPDSLLFGRGSTGGVVNQANKQPELVSHNSATATFGSDLTRRGTLDINAKIDDTSALRLNIIGQDGNVAGRDGARNRRYGVAPSLALGLGRPTRMTFNYFHQTEDNIPDYGVPWFYSRPADVPRENFYGFKKNDADYLQTNVDIGTAKIEHDFSGSFTLRNQTRLANYQRKGRITAAQMPNVPGTTPLESITVGRNEIALESTETMFANQTDLTSKFTTGSLKHVAVTGVELAHETSEPTRYNWAGVPGTNLVSPNAGATFSGTQSVRTRVKASADSFALYAVDTLSITPQWDIIGGLRWDYVESVYDQSVAPAVHFTREDSFVSWRTGLVYKPASNGSIYFSTGTSFNPSIEQLSLSAATVNTPPEETISYEVGTKWDLFDKRMGATFALFRNEKTNARTPDPNNPLLNVVSGKQRIDGLEIGLNGHVTKEWQVFAGYAFMLSEIVESNNPLEKGNKVANTPKHTFNAWTTYDLPSKLQLGGGMNFVSERNASTTPNSTTRVMQAAPGYVTFSAMAKYPLTEKVDVQLNITNLFDKKYYDQLHPGHVVPGAGRTFLLTTSVKF
jgi:catecholate siderophore receptor